MWLWLLATVVKAYFLRQWGVKPDPEVPAIHFENFSGQLRYSFVFCLKLNCDALVLLLCFVYLAHAMQGHLDEKEEEFLKHAITNSEIMISYHPTLESLPDLGETLEKVEFLHDLLPEDRQQ